ncbi:hypothetical protein K501DRAFT_193068, partial [Backusella circina FSU 941]
QPSGEESENNGSVTHIPSSEINYLLTTDSDILITGDIRNEVLEGDRLKNGLLEHASSTSTDIKHVSLESVKMYIAIVVDLFNEQSLDDPHIHSPHPHGKLVDALKQRLTYEEQKHKGEK